jgi:serine/threonine protein kinase
MPPDLIEYASARVGTSLGTKYRLERLIGAGGMASVYEAAHRNGLRVAIKVLHPHLSIDADLRGRFLREGYVANKVKHRGAVRVLDDDTAPDGAVYLVMELLEGETLDGLLQRRGGRLPLRDVCELADQLLETLTAAHDHQVVHRDIKPENLFLTTDGVLKVLDFGIARLREPGGPEAATRTGRMIGTPAFMPPEQALGRSRQIGGQTDLWAVGATMFTLASVQLRA